MGDGIVRPAATQDGIRLLGRAGGTGNFYVSLATDTLSGNRTLTLANGDTTLVAGTMVNTARTLTVAGTANQVISSAGAQSLAGNRTWTLSLPQDIATTSTPTFGGLTINGSIGIRAAATATTSTQIPVFIADPSATTQTLVTRTPTQLRTDIGATTVGGNLFTLANPSAIRFIRINADNTVTALSDSDFRTAIGAGTSSTTGTVTSIATNDGVTGGTITTTGTIGLTGQALALHNLATNGLIARTGAGTVAGRTITGTTNQISVSNGDGVSGNPTLSTPQNIHTGANPTFAGVIGTSYFDAGTSSGYRLRNAAGTANLGGFTRRGLWEGNANTDPAIWAETGLGLYFYTNGDGVTAKGIFDTSGNLTLPGATTTLSFSSATGAKTISTGGSTDLALSPGGNVRVKTAGLTGGGALQVGGDVRASGEVFAFSSSDKRLKDNIIPISNPIEKILKIGGYTFDWNDKQTSNSGKDYGVIAQEIEEIMPELVNINHNGFKAVRYEKITPLLIEAIKEQNSIIEIQKQRIDKLEELIQRILNK